MRKIAGYLTKNRSEKGQKVAQSAHENRHIKPGKTFCRNSKQLLSHRQIYGKIPSRPHFRLSKYFPGNLIFPPLSRSVQKPRQTLCPMAP